MIEYGQVFIDNMKSFRKTKCISQAELAELCDVSNGTIGNIESGITKPSFDLIVRIAKALGIKPENLFYTDESGSVPVVTDNKFTKEQIKRIKACMDSAVDAALKNL